ncbi:MAG: hypothetical protein B6243_11795 [Anaerolineaceae bacterium 4572_5.2]|nr:MAG: hypothetical protein B6243_11795 [Anaerolineaceae bacterium 4572_5.2]
MPLAPRMKRLQKRYAAFGSELFRHASNELHFLVSDDARLLSLVEKLRDNGFYLLSITANDEQELEDYCFKLYYLFSHATNDLFLIMKTDTIYTPMFIRQTSTPCAETGQQQR